MHEPEDMMTILDTSEQPPVGATVSLTRRERVVLAELGEDVTLDRSPPVCSSPATP